MNSSAPLVAGVLSHTAGSDHRNLPPLSCSSWTLATIAHLFFVNHAGIGSSSVMLLSSFWAVGIACLAFRLDHFFTRKFPPISNQTLSPASGALQKAYVLKACCQLYFFSVFRSFFSRFNVVCRGSLPPERSLALLLLAYPTELAWDVGGVGRYVLIAVPKCIIVQRWKPLLQVLLHLVFLNQHPCPYHQGPGPHPSLFLWCFSIAPGGSSWGAGEDMGQSPERRTAGHSRRA